MRNTAGRALQRVTDTWVCLYTSVSSFFQTDHLVVKEGVVGVRHHMMAEFGADFRTPPLYFYATVTETYAATTPRKGIPRAFQESLPVTPVPDLDMTSENNVSS